MTQMTEVSLCQRWKTCIVLLLWKTDQLMASCMSFLYYVTI